MINAIAVVILYGASMAAIAVATAIALRRRRAGRSGTQPEGDAAQAAAADPGFGVHLRQLSRLNDALGHDIRGPLNTMMLNLELLRKVVAGYGPDVASILDALLEEFPLTDG